MQMFESLVVQPQGGQETSFTAGTTATGATAQGVNNSSSTSVVGRKLRKHRK